MGTRRNPNRCFLQLYRQALELLLVCLQKSQSLLLACPNRCFPSSSSNSHSTAASTSTQEELKDDQRLLDYGIQQGSTLHLVSQDLAGMKIYVRLPSDQRTIAVEVKACDIIQNIESIIQAKEGIPSDRYTLIYDGKLLEDNGILASLNISNESTLHLVVNPKDVIQIYVGVGTEEIVKLEVKLLFTIREVNAIIGGMIGVPVDDWDLVYAGNKLTGCKTLASYGIEEGTVLKMFPAMIQIFVKTWSGKTITIYVQHHYTIKNVKYRIRCDFQIILFAGNMLEDNRDLASYGVQMHSTLSMVFSPSQTIIPMRIDCIENPIQRFTTICNLKAMIEKKR
ncbi:hypothetical protein CMV_012214 [Castanea mollissima]|uniref:Ubiquitin-like domain-containing protein n=1 Tax=Castanea mollissima TaxID=60419 RepID=A0A8J4RF89_9ROSI|nr:hypothetical protein CMV_012214 [Castanea mollissima]